MNEQSNDRRVDSGAATGIIIWNGHAFGIMVPPPLLVLDLVAWVKYVQVKYEATADLCIGEGILDGAKEYRRDAAALEQWAETREGRIWEHPALYVRQALLPYQVDKTNMEAYLSALFRSAEPVSADEEMMFLFVADGDAPCFYTTPRLRFVAQHTGHEVQGVVLESTELKSEIARARTNLAEFQREEASRFPV